MPKGRNLKAKLKKTYQVKTSGPVIDNKPIESVSDKINRLRIEHLRASEKPLRQQNLSTKYNNKKQQVMGVAGPPPPASWLVNNVTHSNNLKDNKKKKKHYYYNNVMIDTLCKQCAFQVANSITSYLSIIPDLPVRTRQLILSYCNGLDDTCFLPFVAFDYGDLQLVDSIVTFNKFLKSFWRLDLIDQGGRKKKREEDNDEEEEEQEEELLDDWEDGIDLEEEEEDYDNDNGLVKFIYNPDNIETNSKNRNYHDGDDDDDDNDDIKDERTFYIQQAIDVLQKKKKKNRGSSNQKDRLTTMILSTPLSIKLVSLNISFSKNWPNLTLAHLLIATLPNLKSLGTAGVFSNSLEGPRAISLLSNRLSKLEEWDIGFHDWIATVDLLFGNNSLILWNVDLKHLKRFYIRGLVDENDVGEQLALKLKDAGYKFKVIY